MLIELDSTRDLDIVLVDLETGTETIAWPDGMLSGASEECRAWRGARYCYSGYNGDQTAGGLGDEWIRIDGDCHTPTWCGSDETAAVDCSELFHIAVPGAWTCTDEFVCRFCEGGPDDEYVADSPEMCARIRYACDSGERAFSNACGCGCRPE